jgi:hypothetical protein
MKNKNTNTNTACRILQGIIGISKFFLEEPDHTEKGMHDYYDVISKPMWFRKSEYCLCYTTVLQECILYAFRFFRVSSVVWGLP